ncbi:MAG: PAS domain S-box protein [Candidatus Melainabacteria bacterium]|nr:MAG: PAS domain S-box protein [Candidatus Melainabacteria bacterium]
MQTPRNEEAALDAKSRFGLLCESLPVGLLVIDSDGIIQLTNRKTAKILGIKREDWVGCSLLDLFEKQGSKSFDTFFEEVKNRGGSIELESKGGTALDDPSGNTQSIPIELSLSDFPIAANNKLLLATVMDITERREFQRLKQELIAMVSHDMATPLASVQLALEFIASKELSELTEGDLNLAKKAEKSVAHLVKLVDDLLTVERLESGKIDLVPEWFLAGSLLEESAELLQDFAVSKQVTIECEPTELRVYADQSRLKQVVMNFLSNAIKFSPPDSVVSLSASSTDIGVRFSVVDRGRGVPSSEQQLIFQRFHQVEKDDAKKKGGRGLGLAICKALVEGHGGQIGVISETGKGSTFWFTIPNKEEPGK